MWKRNLIALVVVLLASALLTSAEHPSAPANNPRSSAAFAIVDPDDIALDGLSLPLTPEQLTVKRGKPDYIDKEWRHFVQWSYSRTTVTFSYLPFEQPRTSVKGRLLTSHGQTVLWLGATERRARAVLARLGEPTRGLIAKGNLEGPFKLEYRGEDLKTGIDITIEDGKVSEIVLCPGWSQTDEFVREFLKDASRTSSGNSLMDEDSP